MNKCLPDINKLPDELLLKVLRLSNEGDSLSEYLLPRVCKRWNALYASPSLWESLVITMPLVRQHSPSWERVQTWERAQTRLLGAERLTLTIRRSTAQEHDLTAAGLEGELLTAHLLFVLSHAYTCKLRKLSISSQYPGRHTCYALNGHVYRAISRFTLLTALSFGSLTVDAETLQLTALRFSDCALSSGEVSGDIETPPGIHQLRRLQVVGCGSASTLVSGISALQNLEHLEIAVGDSLGTIGKLCALTRLRTKFYGTGPHYELHLENPKLQFLSVLGFKNINIPDESMWRCLSSLTTLRELHTENLRLADLPGEVSLLTRLTSLHHRDGLAKLSTNLSPLQKLMELDISGSSLDCIPALPCPSLETLKMDSCHCSFRLTQEGFSRLKALPCLRKVTLNDSGHILDFPQEIICMARELPLMEFEIH